jgi:cytochrome P450
MARDTGQAHGRLLRQLRTPYGVLVAAKTLVQQVLDDAQRNYSVSGYNLRLKHGFGEIYLGRDIRPGEDAEADDANRAIMDVTRAEAFDRSYVETAALLQATLAAVPSGDELAVDVKDLVDDMLARVSAQWFGIPDGRHVRAGGWHWRSDATCPGHFLAPSRHTFQPQPGAMARDTGQAHGRLLRQQVRRHVAAARDDPSLRGTLGVRLYDIHAQDDDRLATLLIGVMMGFLPTVDGNLRGLLYEWVLDRSLWDHRAALRRHRGGGAQQRAEDVLLHPLQHTLQLRPVPELVWRTALRSDRIGPLAVRAGDTVVLALVSATQEDRLAGRRGLATVFGGNRRATPHPPHACPGYDMAIGVMLGFLAALLETVRLRPANSPMALRIARP